MKVSKVDRVRVAVGRKLTKDGTRGILYRIADGNSNSKVEAIVSERVGNANRLYSVFFKSNYPKQLEGHFSAIVTEIQRRKGGAKAVLKTYKKYDETFSNGKIKSNYIDKMSYSPAGKDLDQTLRLYVYEKLCSSWHNRDLADAVVEVLKCICNGKEFDKMAARLSQDTLVHFERGCLEAKNAVFAKSTSDLEKMFTILMRMTAEKCDTALYMGAADLKKQEADLEKQIRFLAGVQEVSFGKDKKTGKPDIRRLKEFSYKDAGYTRMDAMMVRMRRGLKRGELRETAIDLLLALSQVNGRSWKQEIERLMANEETANQLKKFIREVNKDFYHFNVVKSVKNTEVAVRSEGSGKVMLSNAGKEKKQGLQETLLSYAASEADSDMVLLRLKTLLFSYFLGDMEDVENRIKASYLTIENLWKFRGIGTGLFDAEFVSDNPLERV